MVLQKRCPVGDARKFPIAFIGLRLAVIGLCIYLVSHNMYLMRPYPTLHLAVLLAIAPTPGGAQVALTVAQRDRIDSLAAAVLKASGTPSASIAVVRNGAMVYEHAYGTARVAPDRPATTATRYSIGSVSKQFTAAAVLMLVEEKKLSLDDKVAKWLPDLTRANDVTVRELLSMTAGYQDYWPQDYVFAAMLAPTTAQKILNQWARIPLDFEPGTQWQYSNTNFLIAGLIVERVSGMHLYDFLKARVFTPLHMTTVADVDATPLGAGDAGGYLRNALGPLRPAPKEAPGWLFGAAELAMTAHDLALWDLSIINKTLLKPESYKAMETTALLSTGLSARYGLGIGVASVNGRRQLEHDGAVSGYLAENEIYPDDRTAIVVLANIYPGATSPESDMANGIGSVLFETASTAATTARDQARAIFIGLQHGMLDRALFTANANGYFSAQAIADFSSSLGLLGAPTSFTMVAESLRGGMTFREYEIKCRGKMLDLTVRALPDGKIEQYQVTGSE